MYYCSIEDAWGNNLKNNFFNYNSEPTNTQKETIYNSVNHNDKNPNNIHEEPNNIHEELNNIEEEHIEIEKSINNKKILLEKKIKKLQNKKNKLFKMQNKQNKIKGGNNQSDLNNSIILGLLLLFIIDYFGNLSY